MSTKCLSRVEDTAALLQCVDVPRGLLAKEGGIFAAQQQYWYACGIHDSVVNNSLEFMHADSCTGERTECTAGVFFYNNNKATFEVIGSCEQGYSMQIE